MSLIFTNKISNFSLVCVENVASKLKTQVGPDTENIRIEVTGNLNKKLFSATYGADPELNGL